MKFSSSLKFNAISEWWDEYISYDALKKKIYQLEKQQTTGVVSYHDIEATEQQSLLGSVERSSNDAEFERLLNKDLTKIVLFYDSQEKEYLTDVTALEDDVRRQDSEGAVDRYQDEADDDDDEDDESLSRSPEATRRQRKLSSGSRRNIVTGSVFEPGGSTRPHRLSISSADTLDTAGVPTTPTTMSKLANKFGTLGESLRDSFTTSGPDTIWTSRTDYAYDTRLLFKRRITTLFVSVSNLRSYVEVNQSGFRKILKKYDKVIDSKLKDRYMHETVETAPPFLRQSKDKLNEATQILIDLYSKCVTRGNRQLAAQQLKLHQRENIAWERDTVWRQMIAQQRRGEVEDEPMTMGALLKKPGPELFFIPTPLGSIRVTKKMIYKIIAGIIFVTILNVPVVDVKEANRCLALLAFCTFLWATEAIPLFVTSMFVPLLLVLLQVVRDKHEKVLSRQDATTWVFQIMFSSTIMLLIGGFTIASALSKTNIDRVLVTRVLSLAGTKPSTVLLAFMGVSCFASMWISNVAAPTLCFTLIRPILRNLPPKSAFGPCLILGIALAANIGGQSSPISSPQNIIALAAMQPSISWASWFAVSLPVSGISILLIWALLLISYRPARSPDGEGYIEIKQIRPTKESFTHKQWWVSFVCLVTIGLWCVAHEIEAFVGDMGVIAIFPVVAFFSTGILKKDDFEQFTWTIVFLAMGGIALGKGVMSSGLLDVVDKIIRGMVEGAPLYTIVLILSPTVLIISTFISHTIASVLLVPIAKEVGKKLPGSPQNLLIFITGLICSTGMGMPVSGFPNQTAATQEDELGELYLTNMDFFKNGVPASIIATAVVSTVGYLLMRAIGL